MKPLRIGEREVGAGLPALLVAEIGINHNGDLDLAKASIDAAASAGACSVKFQNYRTEDFIFDRSLAYEYVSNGKRVRESQWDMFKRCELHRDALRVLAERARERGVIFHSTPTGEDGVADLVAVGAPVLKNGSDFLGHVPLVRAMARTGKPTVLSTGMATLAEIDEAVRAFRAEGNDQLILLHCTSSYPTPPEQVNLRKMPALGAAFDCHVGFSDHTAGIAAAVAAATLGACWIEKHFTLDRSLPGPDHSFSSDPAEFKELVRAVRAAETALGTSRIGPADCEREGRASYRLSCVAARALPAGHVLGSQDLAFRRPGTGVPPAQAELLVGRTLRRALEAGALVALGDLA